MKTFQRIMCFALFLIPCMFLFTACSLFGGDSTSISHSSAFNKTGIPRLNAGTVQSYRLRKDGYTEMVLSGLSLKEIDNYKKQLMERDGFINSIADSVEAANGVWWMENTIDGHAGDNIRIELTPNSDSYTAHIQYYSYFSVAETITNTSTLEMLENFNDTGIYLTSYYIIDGEEIFPSEQWPNSLVDFVNCKTEYGVEKNGRFAKSITHTVYLTNGTVLEYKMRFVQDVEVNETTGVATPTENVYFFLTAPAYDVDPNVDEAQKDQGLKVFSTTQLVSANQIINENININYLIKNIYPSNVEEMLNTYTAKGKMVYNNKVLDTEIYWVNAKEYVYGYDNNKLVAKLEADTAQNLEVSENIPSLLLSTESENYSINNAYNHARIFSYFNNYEYLNKFRGLPTTETPSTTE
ncbi:MAG: hypothetical protein IJZ26_02170 [Clostridia bacterium]|nr:hypothetical protein [Clostridia bacterium]MBQ9786403.1 hypothetical protein [Clostridia bacterium]